MEMGMGINIEFSAERCPYPRNGSRSRSGGRRPQSDQPPTEGKKPSLRIAEPSEEKDAEMESEDAPPGSAPYVTQVKVLQGNPFGSANSIPFMGEHGWISLPNDGPADAAWQTIYQGLRPRLYRIACLQGARIDVTVDGTQVERLNPGQSIDVEGMAIRVTNPDNEIATGTYMPVQSEWNEE